MIKNFLLYTFIIHCFCWLDVTVAEVHNREAHRRNGIIAAEVVEKALSTMGSGENVTTLAKTLSQQIDTLGQELLARGFDPSIYSYRTHAQGTLYFDSDRLWEGGNRQQNPIPLTLLIYSWPSEQRAMKRDLGHCVHASNIHGHPISCALTVLRGSITQENYERLPRRSQRLVQLTSEEIFEEGEGAFDDQHAPFIHRIVCRYDSNDGAITLHAYGAPTQRAVTKIFNETFDEYSFRHVLEPSGKITIRPW